MAEANFEKLREDLKTLVKKEAWDKMDKDYTFRKTLKAIFGKAAREKYIECVTDTTKDFNVCLEEAARDLGLGDKFRSAWRGVPADLMRKLREVRDKWGSAEREAIRAAVRAKDIPRLYKLCAYGEYDKVMSELGLEERPTHFKNCVKLVALAQDLEGALAAVWGTA